MFDKPFDLDVVGQRLKAELVAEPLSEMMLRLLERLALAESAAAQPSAAD